jgi:hypothetical protein
MGLRNMGNWDIATYLAQGVDEFVSLALMRRVEVLCSEAGRAVGARRDDRQRVVRVRSSSVRLGPAGSVSQLESG